MNLDISDLSQTFPDFRVAALVVTGASIGPRSPALSQEIAAREAAFRDRWGSVALADIPGIAVWRAAYRAFGIKKTSYRCSVERLAKNAQAERPLPQINSFVDGYNAVSLTHVMPLGADDLDHVVGDIAFRFSRPDDDFRDMGVLDADGAPAFDPPKAGEVVYADSEKVLCRRWNWRQDARSLVTPDTSRAVITVQYNGAGDLDAAVEDLAGLIETHCRAQCAVTIADAQSPVMALAGL
ncbi:phenylalanine--tRNA ligase beta subunit-related protein [Breoghania sp.]|uniref:B3/B4 domain-containing protein n=1 Tax=Breoghania sp. TaxID=2065378 RepID=UPI002AA5EE1F|nr:phenylalanine--tRNA ligase beta subunit-related protein [Breoghania sp.]